MTNKEASDILDDYDVNFDGHTAEEVAEAFDVAFRALEQEPCENVLDINDGNIYECPCGYGWNKSKVVRHHFCPNCGRAVNSSYNSIKTELKPCEDAISRQAALDIYDDYNVAVENGELEAYRKHRKRLLKLPPVTPQPKTGHWIYGEDLETGRDGWYCNQCRHFEFWDYSLDMKSAELNLPNVCPQCRTKMNTKLTPKQTDDNCLDFDFDKVKEILKKDGLDNLIVDHTCEEKQEQTRDEKMIDAINFAIKATDSQDDYSMGMRNGMKYVKSLIDGKEPQYELRWTDEEIKLGIDLGDEVVNDYGVKGVVVGIDTYKGEVLLSLLMRNHKVPQLVKASSYKTKTNKHFPQIIEVLEQIKGEANGK